MVNDIFFKAIGNCNCNVEFGIDYENETRNELRVSVNKNIFNDYELYNSIDELKKEYGKLNDEIFDEMRKALIEIFNDIDAMENDFECFGFSTEMKNGEVFFRLFAKRKNDIAVDEGEVIKNKLIDNEYIWINQSQ